MNIIVNGETRQMPDHCSVAELVAAMDLTGKRIAVEINLDIVPRSAYEARRLQAGDRVEIVHAIGGG
ncbi:MAG: sulfur carrier protein ThiS [Gammaproteobacteria bacterium]|nr:sulfur carrier protein ThiS [Gammaproteobacteria bacterium]